MGNVYSSLSDISFRFHQNNDQDFNYMVQDVGFGIRYKTPVGPLRVDFAYGLNPPHFVGFKGTVQDLLACNPNLPPASCRRCARSCRRASAVSNSSFRLDRLLMRLRLLMLIACSCLMAQGTMIDRTSIIVGEHAILESQINRDIRVTDFLNRDPLIFSLAARRAAASRLVDQEIIRQQIRSGDYPVATEAEADETLAQLQRERFGGSDAAFRQALARYGITFATLKDRLLWQMTVLGFIDARFRPAVVVTDQEIQQYYKEHEAALKREHPPAKSAADLRSEIEQIVAGTRVSQLLDEWLKDQRTQIRIEYLDKSLA